MYWKERKEIVKKQIENSIPNAPKEVKRLIMLVHRIENTASNAVYWHGRSFQSQYENDNFYKWEDAMEKLGNTKVSNGWIDGQATYKDWWFKFCDDNNIARGYYMSDVLA